LDEQISEIRAVLGDDPGPFTRCPECNGVLRKLAHEAARDLVPAYTWHTQTAFQQCEDCGRVFWKGTHWPGLQARLKPEANGEE